MTNFLCGLSFWYGEGSMNRAPIALSIHVTTTMPNFPCRADFVRVHKSREFQIELRIMFRTWESDIFLQLFRENSIVPAELTLKLKIQSQLTNMTREVKMLEGEHMSRDVSDFLLSFKKF
jgi:hypothetical protein